MSGSRDILVVGSSSRIAAALAPLLGDSAAYVGRRSIGRAHETIVADYASLPVETLTGISCVVNCVGISTGDPAHLDAINVDVASGLAVAAKAAGVRNLIHVSSFSVYGGADTIDRDTPAVPTSDYGRSKLKADNALLSLADDNFSVTILRLPLVYAPGSMGKLGQLLRLWARMRILPIPAPDVARAMIGVEMSAETIARLAGEPRAGVVFAADPRAFTYAETARTMSQVGTGARTLHRLSVPCWLAQTIARISPAIGGRLFADSRLADEDNLAVSYGLSSRLYRDIAAADLG